VEVQALNIFCRDKSGRKTLEIVVLPAFQVETSVVSVGLNSFKFETELYAELTPGQSLLNETEGMLFRKTGRITIITIVYRTFLKRSKMIGKP